LTIVFGEVFKYLPVVFVTTLATAAAAAAAMNTHWRQRTSDIGGPPLSFFPSLFPLPLPPLPISHSLTPLMQLGAYYVNWVVAPNAA